MTTAAAWRLTLRAWGMAWRKTPGWFAATILDALFAAALPYATIWCSAQLINEIAGARNPQSLRRWIIVILAVTVVLSLLSAVCDHWKNAAAATVGRLGIELLSDRMLTLDYPIVDDQRTIDAFDRIRQSDNFSGSGMRTAIWTFDKLLPAVFQIAGGIGLSVTLFSSAVPENGGALTVLNSPWMSLGMAAMLLAAAFGAARCNEIGGRAWWRFDELGRFGNRVFDFFGLLFLDTKRTLDIHLYDQYGRVAIPFVDANPVFTVRDVNTRAVERTIGVWHIAAAAVTALMTGLVYVFVCLKAWGGAFGVGSVTQYVGAITALFLGVSALLRQAGEIRNNAPFLGRVFDFLDQPNRMYQGSLTTEKRADRQYDVEFRDVSFRYPNAPADQWALSHVNLRFRVGSRLAIVGENGSGKTTFIKLLCRLYDPTEGEILLNGIDIRKYRYDEYMRIFSVVFQDFQLFALPLGQNVAANVRYDRDRVTDALRKADFGDRLDSLPRGLETSLYKDLDEDGVELSGGEAQKVAIARAIYQDAPFIVLDEPTAALDPVAEARIYAKFNEIAGDKTAVYISHRLSSCKFCDEIAVFDHGAIVQYGTHDELVADAGGKYAELWHAQAQYYAA
ncbi:ATP-binding cassette domain-containing protein [Bifidobacterium ramosum]|nr:ATP-binding cassette domain-containing protein [Bifidobacterium ramosum]